MVSVRRFCTAFEGSISLEMCKFNTRQPPLLFMLLYEKKYINKCDTKTWIMPSHWVTDMNVKNIGTKDISDFYTNFTSQSHFVQFNP